MGQIHFNKRLWGLKIFLACLFDDSIKVNLGEEGEINTSHFKKPLPDSLANWFKEWLY